MFESTRGVVAYHARLEEVRIEHRKSGRKPDLGKLAASMTVSNMTMYIYHQLIHLRMDRVHYRYQSYTLRTESSALYRESTLVPYLPSPW